MTLKDALMFGVYAFALVAGLGAGLMLVVALAKFFFMP